MFAMHYSRLPHRLKRHSKRSRILTGACHHPEQEQAYQEILAFLDNMPPLPREALDFLDEPLLCTILSGSRACQCKAAGKIPAG